MPLPVAKKRPPLWAGPCGQGPQGGITQSMISRWYQCPERMRLATVEGLTTGDGWNFYIEYGHMWHGAEEYSAGGKDWRKFVMDYAAGLLKQYRLDQEDILKWRDVILAVFPVYLEYYAAHRETVERKPLLQEYAFDVPYTLPRSGRVVRLRGKMDGVDLIGKGRMSQVWLFETKTKSVIDRPELEKQVRFDLQCGMYLSVLEMVCKSPPANIPAEVASVLRSRPIAGVRYNCVTRWCGIKQKKGSKNVPAETRQEWLARLVDEYARPNAAEWFQRWNTPLSAADTARFRKLTLDPLLEMICDWYAEVTGTDPNTPPGYRTPLNYVRPYGIRSLIDEGGTGEMDSYIHNGTTAGLSYKTSLFQELQP